MKKILLSISMLLFFFSFVLNAQETVDMQMMQKIKDEEKQHSQVEMIAHNLTDICGPRLTNSPGYKGHWIGRRPHLNHGACKMRDRRHGENLEKDGARKNHI